MILKKFRYNVVFRAILLAISFLVAFYFIYNQHFIVSPILIFVFIVLQLISLVKYVDRTNKELSGFLESVRYSDFTRSYQIGTEDSSFDLLKETFNNVMKDFQKIRSEKEEHFYYIHNIIEQVEISIIAFRKDGTIEMINNAAKKLFQVKRLNNIADLKSWSAELVEKLIGNERTEKSLVKINDNDELLQLAIHLTEFRLNERYVTLVTIKDIQTELEEQEMEAWQKLIRVLTHEIMNSIAPIASLASTMNLLVDNLSEEINASFTEDFDKESIKDIKEALKTIHKRSTGLIHFVETYRNLTRIPKPNFNIFNIKPLLESILALLTEDMKQQGIVAEIISTPENIQLTADEQLIEQVIINLIKNSIHALQNKKNGKITVKAYKNKRDKVIIQIIDNGQGIIDEVKDKIFIPFFTTKGNGSGIGLSLSKQIMRMHNGTITVHSEPEVETSFTLTF